MLFKSTKSLLIVCLLTTLLLSIFGCLTGSSTPDPNNRSIKDLEITMDVNDLGKFRAQIRKFADKHSLKFEEAFYNKDHTYFSVFMETNDFHIVVSNRIDSPGEFGFSFFNSASPPISQETFDELFNDFKGYVMEIPNVRISERIKSLVITIDENRSQEVLDQLQKFADKHSLDFKLSFSSDKSIFHLEIYGDGFHIIGGLGLKDHIRTTFYIDSDNEIPNPTPFPQETFDELFNDLKNFLEEIPDATVVETY